MTHLRVFFPTRLAEARCYGVAFLSCAGALGLALFLRRFEGMTVTPFLMAIAVSVWYADIKAGVVAILLSILAVDYFFTAPLYRFTFDPSNLPYLVVFTAFGLVFSLFSVSRRRTEQQLRQAHKELEGKVAERTAELRRSEALLAEGERLSRTGTWAFKPTTKEFVFCSAETFRLFGCEPGKGIPSFAEWSERIHPKDRETILKYFGGTAADYEVDFRVLLPDGATRYIHGAGHPVFNAAGDVVEIVGSAIDVTERKRTEEALRETEYYLTEGERLTHTGSYAWNAAIGLVHVSAELRRIFGFDPEQPAPVHADFRARVHPDDLAMFDALGERSIREGADLDWVYRIVLPDGTLKYLHVVARPVFNASGEVVGNIGTTQDVTERKRAEQDRERLRQAESDLAHTNRVTMLGELAASISHELRQPITATMTNARTTLRWLNRDDLNRDAVRQAAERIEKDGARATEIIDRLRALYKKTPPKRELVDVNEIIGEMVVMLRGEANRFAISIRTDLAADLPKVTADRVQVQQVLMNFMLNGIEAMNDTGGVLTVKSQRENGPVLISVSDTGVGLPPEKADKIFDAFFTTKPQGSGMGLAISRSIIESHDGQLWATPNDGRGATFHFTLPIASEAAETPTVGS